MSRWAPARAALARRWPALRAALLLGVVGQAALDAVPLPRITEGQLAEASLRAELRAHAQALAALRARLPAPLAEQLPTPAPAAVGALLISLSHKCNIARDLALAPTAPLRRALGLGQSWGLFALPSPEVGRLVVRGLREDGVWVDVFRAGEGGAPALAGPLAGRRLRGVWDEAGDRARPWPSWARLVDWIAAQAFAADPALIEVEVRIDRERLHLPGGPATGAARPLHRAHRRRPLLPPTGAP